MTQTACQNNPRRPPPKNSPLRRRFCKADAFLAGRLIRRINTVASVPKRLARVPENNQPRTITEGREGECVKNFNSTTKKGKEKEMKSATIATTTTTTKGP